MGTRTFQTRGRSLLFQRLANLLKVEKYNNDIQLDDRRKLMTRHYANGYVSINAEKGAPRVRMRSDGRRYDGIGMRRTRFDV